MVERLRSPGGVVVANGGVPTKTLRETAMYLTGFMNRETYGLSMELQTRVLAEKLTARTQAVCQTIAALVRQNIKECGIELIHGDGRLGPDRTVIVTPHAAGAAARVLHARSILIATGSRPFHPAAMDFDDPDVWDNERVLAAGRIPGNLVIIGAGAIGCEYGSIYRSLGSAVTIVDSAERLLPFLDAELSGCAAATYARAGIRLRQGYGVESVQRVGGVLTVQVTDGTSLEA